MSSSIYVHLTRNKIAYGVAVLIVILAGITFFAGKNPNSDSQLSGSVGTAVAPQIGAVGPVSPSAFVVGDTMQVTWTASNFTPVAGMNFGLYIEGNGDWHYGIRLCTADVSSALNGIYTSSCLIPSNLFSAYPILADITSFRIKVVTLFYGNFTSQSVQGYGSSRITIQNLKNVFVTSGTWTGNLGGLAGADSKCQAAANSNPRFAGKIFKAWLSDNETSSSNASARLTHSTGPYNLYDGTSVASNWTDLTDGTLSHVINQSEGGVVVKDAEVWTDTSASGSETGHHCVKWANATNTTYGGIGWTYATDSDWSAGHPAVTLCNDHAHLYCFEQ